MGITGSTAYGEPKSGDDLDFIVVTRKGALWVFVLYAVLAARIQMRTWTSDDTFARASITYLETAPRPKTSGALADSL